MEKLAREQAGHRGAERWLTIHEELLRGIAHALSNRVATMSVVTFMLDAPGADVARQADAMRGETERVEELLMAMRALPRQVDPGAEPLVPADAVRAALTLHAHHGDLRDIACDVSGETDAMPVLADPQALQHALVVLLGAARRHAAARGTRATLALRNGDGVVEFAALGGAPDGEEIDELTAADADAAGWLMAKDGGHVTPHPTGCVLRLPTLQAARQRAT